MLVIGLGEVGKAVRTVLTEAFPTFGMDQDKMTFDTSFDAIHVCFPYFDGFVDAVKEYQEEYLCEGGLTVIHSSTPIGTTGMIHGAVHSPIRGVHPHLVEGIKTFVKYFGGPRSPEAARVFNKVGVKTMCTWDARSTEALKLFDTLYYGWNIVFEKEVKDFCDKHGLPFDLVYTLANQTYDEGYEKLGRPEVRRPVLKHVDGPIGGHCIIQNAKLLGGDIAEMILKKNKEY